jgi:hypothetical protein
VEGRSPAPEFLFRCTRSSLIIRITSIDEGTSGAGFDVGRALSPGFIKTPTAAVEAVAERFIRFHADDAEAHADGMSPTVNSNRLGSQGSAEFFGENCSSLKW